MCFSVSVFTWACAYDVHPSHQSLTRIRRNSDAPSLIRSTPAHDAHWWASNSLPFRMRAVLSRHVFSSVCRSMPLFKQCTHRIPIASHILSSGNTGQRMRPISVNVYFQVYHLKPEFNLSMDARLHFVKRQMQVAGFFWELVLSLNWKFINPARISSLSFTCVLSTQRLCNLAIDWIGSK